MSGPWFCAAQIAPKWTAARHNRLRHGADLNLSSLTSPAGATTLTYDDEGLIVRNVKQGRDGNPLLGCSGRSLAAIGTALRL